MAKKGIYWKGKSIVRPGVYAYINADKMNPDRLSSANTIAALGISLGGAPQIPLVCNGLSEARDLLRGGALYTAAELMYDPSSDIDGAGEIIFIRVNKAIQASGSVGTQLTIKSKDYGKHTNFIRHKVETGTIADTKKLTVQHQVDDVQEVYDNMGLMFNIQYTGSVTHGRMSIDTSAKTLIIETATDSTWSTLVSLDLSDVNLAKVSDIVTILNGRTDIVCTAAKYSDQDMPSLYLDEVTSQDIKTAIYPATAYGGSLKYAIQTKSEILDTPVIIADGAIANYGWTNLTGGTEGATVTNQDWIDALALLENVSYVKILYVATDIESIHLAAQEHVESMSEVNAGKRRRLFCGGAAGETVEEVLTRAVNMGSKRTALAYPGISRYNLLTGELDELAPMYTAAMLAGMAGGTLPRTPLTHKTIKAQGIEYNLGDTDINALLNGGVTPIEFVKEDGIYRVVMAINTWQKDANVIFRKVQGGRIADYVADELVSSCNRYIGDAGDSNSIVSIKNAVETKLDMLTVSVSNTDGVITTGKVDGVVTPSYQNLVVAWDGIDWVSISVQVRPVGEIDYITIETGFIPAKITI
jgi:hypothetical protein